MLKSYIITSDYSQFILPITMYLYKKYRPNTELYCLGYTKPDIEFKDNFHFVELKNGEKRDISSWFNDLYNYFNSIDDEHLFFSTDDIPVIDKIDEDAMNFCMDYIKKNKVALFYGYNNDNISVPFFENDKYVLWNPSNSYGHKTNLQKNIWNRKALLEVLKMKNQSNGIHTSLANFETQGLPYIKSNPELKDYKIVGMKIKNKKDIGKSCLVPTNIWTMCSHKHSDYISLMGLKNEDVKYIVENNLADKQKLIYIYKREPENNYKVFYDKFNYNFTFEKLKNLLIKDNKYDSEWKENVETWEKYFSSLYEKK